MGGLRIPGRLVVRRRSRRRFFADSATEGFTLTEVLIVFAVTGALFVSAALLISGKQDQAAFNTGIRQIQGQIQQAMNEVAAGYFPSNANFQCTAGGSGPNILAVGPNGQGTNSGCIFLGKALQFQVHGTAPEQFATFTIAGLQKRASDGQEVQSLADAKPAVIAPSSSQPGLPSLTTTSILQNGLTTYKMWYNNGGADQPVGVVAFTSSFASYSGSTITSGSQQLNVVPVSGSAINTAKTAAADAINTNLAAGVINPANGVSICFASGGTNESGLVVIGGNKHPLSVTVTIKENKTCT